MSDDDAIVKEFLVESYENLDRLDQDLVVLEKDPANRETLASIFRTIHTIKGTSGFLAFNRLEALTHVGENLLARLRDGVLALNPEITTALLAMVDAVRGMLKSIEEIGKEGERDDKDLIATLTRLLEPASKSAPAPQVSGPVAVPESTAQTAGTLRVLPVPDDSVEVHEAEANAEQSNCDPQPQDTPGKHRRRLRNEQNRRRCHNRLADRAPATAPFASMSANSTA